MEISLLTVESLVALLREKKNFLLSQDVEGYARFVGFDKGRLSLNFNTGVPREIISNLNKFFAENRMDIKVVRSDAEGEPTLKERRENLFNAQLAEISGNPILKEILSKFADARVVGIERLPSASE